MTVKIRQQNGISILDISGKIVGHSVLELRKVLFLQIEVSELPRILINFKRVNMIDSSGLGALMVVHAAAIEKNGRMGAIHVGRHIKNLIVQNRLVNLFEYFNSEDAAVSALLA